MAGVASEVCRLTGWLRAGTTPERHVRRARIILGSPAGSSSRVLARREQLSRTTVRRWIARFVANRCAGLQDLPRSGRPLAIKPATRALVLAVACERPAERGEPLRRYSLTELTLEVTNQLQNGETAPSRSAIWRLLARDALRPWRYHSWIFPPTRTSWTSPGRCSTYTSAGGRASHSGLTSTSCVRNEKTSIQARRRRHPSLRIAPHWAMRIEHEYKRAGVLQYLAAWDVHRAVVFGRCEPKTGKAAFARLVDDVMSQERYRSARRVFWIVDNASSHRGE